MLDRPFGSLLPTKWDLGFPPWLSMTSPRVSVQYCQSPGSKVQSPKSEVQSPKSKARGPKSKVQISKLQSPNVHLDLLYFFKYYRRGSAMVSPCFLALLLGLQVRVGRCLEARVVRCLEARAGRCPPTGVLNTTYLETLLSSPLCSRML